MDTFGERLRDLRNSRNLHQSQLGELLGLSPSAIGSYERNLREPAYKHLTDIADLFSVSVDYLLCRTDEPSTVEAFSKIKSRNLHQLLKDYKVLIGCYEMQERDKEKLYTVAQGLFWDEVSNA